jgi:GMP synthase (glutamine-hydrolysing)
MSQMPALWIVDPAVHTAEEQGVRELLEDWPGSSRVFRPGLEHGDGPKPGSGYAADAVVVLGSSASVHDRLDWAAALADWLLPIVDGRRAIPLLGVCYGHQLVAHLAGGAVEFMNERHDKWAGVETTVLQGSRVWPGRHELRVVVSHREHVTRLPLGYRVIASRPSVPVDGMEHEQLPICCFQFHPEAREEFASRSGIDPAAIDARLRADSRRLPQAFLGRVLDRE